MLSHRLRRLLREPVWFLLLGALIAGAITGGFLASEVTTDAASDVFGKAWRGTPRETRSRLANLLGIQITVLAIVLSLNASVIQSAANQYSPRLVPFYLKKVPLLRALPLFVFLFGYLLVAVRELGLAAEEAVRPRLVVSVAGTLLVAAVLVLTVAMSRTFGLMRVERVLGLVRDATVAAAERVRARFERLPLDPLAKLALPPDAHALVASSSGYVVEVDVGRLAQRARRDGVRARICRAVGDYVDKGEVIGWVVAEGLGPVDARVAGSLSAALVIAPVREPDYDPIYGIRILVDVVARALTSSVNDAYTAKQALQQMRSVLRHLARMPHGDWNVVDPDGAVRVSVVATQLREFVSVAVDAPLRYGAGEPEVLEGVLELALEVGLVARDVESRLAMGQLVARVIDSAVRHGDSERGRFQRLCAESGLARARFAAKRHGSTSQPQVSERQIADGRSGSLRGLPATQAAAASAAAPSGSAANRPSKQSTPHVRGARP
ncbi:MAG: DUF2254 domain-containing protein [Gammaproteobacteria bacterium]